MVDLLLVTLPTPARPASTVSTQPRRMPPPPPPPADEQISLPWDEQAERAVLGAILLEPSALDAAAEKLGPDDFHRPAHRAIFEAMISLSSASTGAGIDVVTLRRELERLNLLEQAGGAAYLSSLVDSLPLTTNVSSYAEIVLDRSLLRRLLAVTENLRAEASKGVLSGAEMIDEAEGRLFQLSDVGRRGGFQPLPQVAQRGLEALEELSERREMVTGVSTGFKKLDWMTSGFQPGDLIIIAARPSMGKTALALNIAQYAATREELAVGVFSLEMSAEQLFFRLLSAEGMVPSQKVRTGRLNADEWERLTQGYERLAHCRMFIDDTPGLTPMEIRAKARRLKRQEDLGLLVIDYLQLMRLGGRVESRQQEISEISRSLKGIAKELKIPVVALSQLSRAPDQRQNDHRPQLSDLRESGAIEQDADVVMFIYRPEVYEKDPEKVIEKGLEGKAELIVAKQRNGPTGTVPLYFVKDYTLFQNREEDWSSD